MQRFTIEVFTEGNTDIVNLHTELAKRLRELKLSGDGLLHLFVVGSTAALTTVEFEPGLIKHDLPAVLQRLVPDDDRYAHEATWNDDNGHSHVRAALVGPGVTVPFSNGKLLTGEYQQVVLWILTRAEEADGDLYRPGLIPVAARRIVQKNDPQLRF